MLPLEADSPNPRRRLNDDQPKGAAPKDTLSRFAKLPAKEAMQAAMVAELDDGIGRLLDALEQSGYDNNTLLFFLSDNGGLPSWWKGSNGDLRAFKRFQYDGGIKVPFIVRWPAVVPVGQVRKQPVSSLDILPTALEAAGIKTPVTTVLDGISLLPALKSQQDLQEDRPLFWAGSHFEATNSQSKEWEGHDNPPPAWAIRRGAWKLMQVMEQGEPVLFNIANDPSESTNLISVNPEIAQKMRKVWIDWFQISNDPIAWKTEYFQQLKELRE